MRRVESTSGRNISETRKLAGGRKDSDCIITAITAITTRRSRVIEIFVETRRKWKCFVRSYRSTCAAILLGNIFDSDFPRRLNAIYAELSSHAEHHAILVLHLDIIKNKMTCIFLPKQKF